MIAGRFDAVRAQQGRDLFHTLARAAVDDPALPPVFPKKAQQLRIAVVRPAHLKKQIRPVKAGQHGIGVFKLQQPRDIPAHGLRGRCGKCAYTRPPRQARDKRLNLQISGAKILSPLADTVRLVDDHLRDVSPAGKAQKSVCHQPLRRHIDDPVCAPARMLKRQRMLARGQRAVQISRPHTVLKQRAHLIPHQRNQRRDHQRDAGQHERRNLIT